MAVVQMDGGIATISLVSSGEIIVIPGEDPGGMKTPVGDGYSPQLRCIIHVRALPAVLSVDVAPADPPSDVNWIKRRSQTWPAPSLDGHGLPSNWEEPTSEVIEDWGRFQVIINGVDVTYYKGVPCIVESFGSSEPFDDDVASILFPQITSLEALPSWLGGEYSVEIKLVRPNGTRKVLWDGFLAADGDSTDQSSFGTRVEAYGSLYDLDRYLAQPFLSQYTPHDLGAWLWASFYTPWAPGLRTSPMDPVTTGIVSYGTPAQAWSPKLTNAIAELLSTATATDGEQWTVMKAAGRKPVLRLKDRSTIHWTVRCGQPGVSHDLLRDRSASFSVYYGEGINPDNCRWRNAIFPGIVKDDAPVYPGVIYYPGNNYDANFRMFKNVLISKGYNVADDTWYHASEEGEIRRFQASYGGLVTGIVAAQTWAGAFEPGSGQGSLDNAYIDPIAAVTSHRDFLTWANGKVPNPDYDPKSVRRETYINFGSGITKAQGVTSAKEMLRRFYPADYRGTIALDVDPQEGHRFEIKAGQNIRLKNHRGTDRTFHIARAEINVESGTVTLDVDQAGRDALTLAEMIRRNTDNATPNWKQEKKYRNSREVESKIASWDCENGSGIIPRHGTFRNLWNVLRIPMASGGEIIRSEFFLDIPARFSVAIWDRPVTHSWLKSFGGTPLNEGYWDQFGDGLVIAWGGNGQAAGYYPGSESSGSGLTGQLVDDASWYYESTQPPWLWVAIWVESPTINYMRGRLYPGMFM